MIVEFAGLPGSGKSTLVRALRDRAAATGVDLIPSNRIRTRSAMPVDVNANPLVGGNAPRALLYQAILAQRAYPAFWEYLGGLGDQLSVDDEFILTLYAVRYLQASDPDLTGAAVVFDEGVLLRGVSICHRVADIAATAFFSEAPLADLILHVGADPGTAFERCIARRPHGTERQRRAYVERKFGDLDAFSRREDVLAAALDIAANRGAKVVSVDNDGTLDASIAAAFDALAPATATRH